MMKLTAEEYVAQQGLCCPKCGDNNLEGHSLDIGGGNVTQEMSCLSCNAKWLDVYALQRYVIDEENPNERRAARGQSLVSEYICIIDEPDMDHETAITDAIADLMHYSEMLGVAASDTIEKAQETFIGDAEDDPNYNHGGNE